MIENKKIKYIFIIILLISPLFWYIPAIIILSPHPDYSNLMILNYAPIHNRSLNIFREVEWLDNESWDFRIEGETAWQSGIPVPSCWNFIPGLENYEGVGFYRRIFNLSKNWENKSTYLHFRGVNYYVEVFLNDIYLGSHEGGYTPFKFNVTGLVNFFSLNTLIVKVDNILSSETVPGTLIGWKNYGGIYREVYLEATNQTYIDSNYITYNVEFGSITNVTVTHNLTIQNSGIQRAVNCSIQVFNQTLDEIDSTTATFNVSPTSTNNILISHNCSDIQLWSPKTPILYYMNVSLFENGTSNLFDKMVYRVGFREIEIVNSTLYLNQEVFLIKGINRHEDFPNWGKTQPYHLLQQDLQLLKDLNVNSIRTFHYPNHPAFLEMCDESGIFIIEEIPAWNIPASDLGRQEVIGTAKQQITEMIERDFNHPCILFWGVGNEIASDKPEGRIFVTEMVQTVKSLDNKTPTYFASNKLEDDISFDLVDIIASNPKYGWYYGEIPDLDEYLEFWHQRYPEKPILITEFSAGSESGDYSGQKYSENYQAYLLQESWNIISSKNYSIGAYVSCFMDYPDLDRMLNPTPFYNQKGLLSYDRSHVKLAFNTTKGMFNETPYVFPIDYDTTPTLYPYPSLANLIPLFIILGGCVVLFLYYIQLDRKSLLHEKKQKFLDKNKTFKEFDLYFSILGFIGLISVLSSLIYTFLKTTTISFPVFDIEENIILRYLITDGLYWFLPYILLYYFVITSLLVHGLARLIKIESNLTSVILTHFKTTQLFIYGFIFAMGTMFGIGFVLIVVISLICIKLVLEGFYLRKNLKISRKKVVFIKVMPIIILFSTFLLYLQIRFDIANLLSLLL